MPGSIANEGFNTCGRVELTGCIERERLPASGGVVVTRRVVEQCLELYRRLLNEEKSVLPLVLERRGN